VSEGAVIVITLSRVELTFPLMSCAYALNEWSPTASPVKLFE